MKVNPYDAQSFMGTQQDGRVRCNGCRHVSDQRAVNEYTTCTVVKQNDGRGIGVWSNVKRDCVKYEPKEY
jgi:hypothetical protein